MGYTAHWGLGFPVFGLMSGPVAGCHLRSHDCGFAGCPPITCGCCCCGMGGWFGGVCGCARRVEAHQPRRRVAGLADDGDTVLAQLQPAHLGQLALVLDATPREAARDGLMLLGLQPRRAQLRLEVGGLLRQLLDARLRRLRTRHRLRQLVLKLEHVVLGVQRDGDLVRHALRGRALSRQPQRVRSGRSSGRSGRLRRLPATATADDRGLRLRLRSSGLRSSRLADGRALRRGNRRSGRRSRRGSGSASRSGRSGRGRVRHRVYPSLGGAPVVRRPTAIRNYRAVRLRFAGALTSTFAIARQRQLMGSPGLGEDVQRRMVPCSATWAGRTRSSSLDCQT